MSISFKTIRGFNNKINLGDSSYNTNISFNKNHIASDGNPRNWGGNHNIEKTKGISAHTRHIQKVGSEVVSNLHRNEDHFIDRMQQNISLYPKAQNIMATGIDYGGSTPYKIGFNGQGSAAASCQLNIADYVQNPSNEHALSRMPVKYVSTFTNKDYSAGGKQFMGNENLKFKNNLKSIKDEYINPSISINKTQKNVKTRTAPDLKSVSSSINTKLQGSVFLNKNVQNPYNNNQKTNDKLPLNENYITMSYSTNKNDKNVTIDNHRGVDVDNHIKHGTFLGNVSTNKIGRDYSTHHNDVTLEKDKLNASAFSNKIAEYKKEEHNRDVELSQEKMNISANTNIKRNANEAEAYRSKPKLSETTPNANVTTNIYKRSNHLDNQQRPRNVRIQETLNVNNHYHNNNVGPRSQTKNLRFNL